MITRLTDVLTSDELTTIADNLESASFADGGATAGWHARGVKNNQQLSIGMDGYGPIEAVVRAALGRNGLFLMAVRPRFMQPIIFSRYQVGMSYGPHVDDSVMTAPGTPERQIRTDVAFTLFLCEPDSYQGGELVVNSGGLEQVFKLPRGSLVAYPASSLHRVAPVTSGVRLAAVSWIQSEIRDPACRSILFDLDMARRATFQREGKTNTFDLISKSHANLLRMWVEP